MHLFVALLCIGSLIILFQRQMIWLISLLIVIAMFGSIVGLGMALVNAGASAVGLPEPFELPLDEETIQRDVIASVRTSVLRTQGGEIVIRAQVGLRNTTDRPLSGFTLRCETFMSIINTPQITWVGLSVPPRGSATSEVIRFKLIDATRDFEQTNPYQCVAVDIREKRI